MCGFAGFLGGTEDFTGVDPEQALQLMASSIMHRGPDDCGYWFDSKFLIGLCHRRLSIIDLSQAGHQPMISKSTRFIIVFNGEIYNHLSLRNELISEGCTNWIGASDTETLLAGFDAWGIKKTIERSIGMFAFAVWDKLSGTLTLGRDRLGEKPLYYGWQGFGSSRVFLFGSELKSLKAHPAFAARIDRGALKLLLRHNCVPSPHSIYEGISKLDPGCLLTLSLGHPEPNIIDYWSLSKAALAGVAQPFLGSQSDAIEQLQVLLHDAVGLQMMADVPLGAFLSGGIDSSLIVALMQTQSHLPVKTFTIGFSDVKYNEAMHASAVAKHLGTQHTELYVTPQQAQKIIPLLPLLYCEPFADSSQIPMFLVSQLARKHVAVTLSGDGGDELFAGYNRYQMTDRLWGHLERVPTSIRSMLAKSITLVSPSRWDSVTGLIPGGSKHRMLGDKLHKGAGVLTSDTVDELYLRLVSHQNFFDSWVIDGKELPTKLSGLRPNLDGLNSIERMMVLDGITYLPDDILVKVDRASMGVSLEGRIPYLDHRVVEFAWTLPLDYKLHEGVTKWPLRQILYQFVPKNLIERPKMGFGVPLDDWLRGPLRSWAENLIDESRLRQEGFFDPIPIRKLWAEHLSGARNWAHHLWSVFMFQAWLEVQ